MLKEKLNGLENKVVSKGGLVKIVKENYSQVYGKVRRFLNIIKNYLPERKKEY